MTPATISGAVVSGEGGRLVAVIDRPLQEIRFTGLVQEPIPSLLRGFSAPVRLEDDLDIDEQIFLLGHDSDPFNRWQAAQAVATRCLIEATAAVRRGNSPVIDPRLVAGLRRTATDSTLDPAFRALVLSLPAESDIARDIGNDVDPDAIHTARDQSRRAIATDCYDDFARPHAELAIAAAYSPNAAGAGRRALANSVLDYLAQSGTADAIARVEASYGHADNMTDRLAALGILVAGGLPG
eukprot:gene38151-46000_t